MYIQYVYSRPYLLGKGNIINSQVGTNIYIFNYEGKVIL